MTGTRIPAPDAPEIQPLLRRHGLGGASAALVYFSFASPTSFIGTHDHDGRITPLIEFLPLPVHGAELLAAIAGIDENGTRLVANYREAFPDLYAQLAAFGTDLGPVRSAALGWLFGAGSLVLGLREDDMARATLPGQSGVRLDTVVIEADGRYLFDGRRLLRSLMSYRIAEVPRDQLARSVFESMGDFAADAIRRLLREWDARAVLCAGDLFAGNRLLRDRARTGLTRVRRPVLFPDPARKVA
ncbi:MAG: hypothetical protein HY241_13945 [Actinobacteria bacterium]|nr:hypothetical protein [Actinomycetota bacterium]